MANYTINEIERSIAIENIIKDIRNFINQKRNKTKALRKKY